MGRDNQLLSKDNGCIVIGRFDGNSRRLEGSLHKCKTISKGDVAIGVETVDPKCLGNITKVFQSS